MKKSLILLFLLAATPFLHAGSLISIPVENSDPYAATVFCTSGEYTQGFNINPDLAPCIGSVKLYYYFKANATNSSLDIGGYSMGGTNSTHHIYGPFNNLPEGAGQINQLAAPSLATATSTGYHDLVFNGQEGKTYILEVTVFSCSGTLNFGINRDAITCAAESSCQDCIPSFNPPPGKYVLSAWVKEQGAAPSKPSYDKPSIALSFPSSSTTYTLHPSGQIIDGWQRIEEIFEVPAAATGFNLNLQVASGAGDAFFDDIRIFPYDGSVISYVYDPVTLRLLAELDERNYAKIYEYDEEGKLTRVKKETEKGIMTIQENRENSVKKP